MKKIDCLAFGAHPDDIELFCSGLLAKLTKQRYTTGIIDLTRGELSSNGTREIRESETKKASEILQVTIRQNLEFQDGNIENNHQNRIEIIKQLREYQPNIVLLPYWEDRHPDHVAASKIITEACYYSGLSKIYTNQEPHHPNTILYYMMHSIFTPSLIVDISKEMDTKIKAIKSYESQFGQSDEKNNETYINKPEFFDSIVNRAKFYGYEINAKYGEPYYYKGILKIDNIMSVFS
ncbi:MAG: bacillithiol biosynthesis deacetylase BshB1 [Calditrichia bacterium]|nr:bacillithiol biosynthesis deacetylase BshB1 [Calditrichia bacterium]